MKREESVKLSLFPQL